MKASGTKEGRRRGRSGNKIDRCPSHRVNEVLVWIRSRARFLPMVKPSIFNILYSTLYRVLHEM